MQIREFFKGILPLNCTYGEFSGRGGGLRSPSATILVYLFIYYIITVFS